MSLEVATLRTIGQSVLSAVRAGESICDQIALGAEVDAGLRHALADAATRAERQLPSLLLVLPPHSKRVRLARQAAQAARLAADRATDAPDIEELERALGQAQRAALRIYDAAGIPWPEQLPIERGPAATPPSPA